MAKKGMEEGVEEAEVVEPNPEGEHRVQQLFRERQVALIERYLDSLHYSLWPSNGWLISDTAKKREAAEWFSDQIGNLAQFERDELVRNRKRRKDGVEEK